jgi:hypothetical protein
MGQMALMVEQDRCKRILCFRNHMGILFRLYFGIKKAQVETFDFKNYRTSPSENE